MNNNTLDELLTEFQQTSEADLGILAEKYDDTGWILSKRTGEYDRTFPNPVEYVESAGVRIDRPYDNMGHAHAVELIWSALEEGQGWAITMSSLLDGQLEICQNYKVEGINEVSGDRQHVTSVSKLEAMLSFAVLVANCSKAQK